MPPSPASRRRSPQTTREGLDVVGDLADAGVELVDGVVGVVDDPALLVDTLDHRSGSATRLPRPRP